MKPISLQLYTLRDAAQEDFPGVLRAVADTGYAGVEFAGLHGHDPKEIAGLVRDLGLQVSSSHVPFPTRENAEQIAETELTLGNRHVISGLGADAFSSPDALKESIEKFNTAAELMKSHGFSFGMHNHWWEFRKSDGRYVYDILMDECPGMFGELDVYWVAYGKADPVDVISRHKLRLPLLHIKDGMLEEGDRTHTAVGSGRMDIPAVIRAADPNILEWLVVELDACQCDMMEAVKESYRYLTSHELAQGNK